MPDALDAARLRLAQHYAGRLVQAEGRLAASDTTAQERQQALQDVARDWAQTEPWLAWSADGARMDPDRAALMLRFVRHTSRALSSVMAPAALLAWVDAGVRAARWLPHDEGLRELLYQAALLNRNLERVDAAEAHARELQTLADAAGDRVAAGRAWLLLGRCLSLRERFVEATECFAACEARLAIDGPSEELIDSLGGRLAGAFFLGEYTEALALGQRQLALAEAAGSLAHMGAAHLALSGVCNHLPGLGERALEHAEQAKAVGRRSGQLRLMTVADVVVGHALRRAGRLDEALTAYRAGLSGPASALPPSAWVNAMHGIGQTFLARSDAAAAQDHFEQALAMARQHPAVTQARVCEVARELVHLHIAQGALEPARDVLESYLDSALAFDAPPHLLSALLAAACWIRAAGQPGTAAAWAAPLAACRERLTGEERARLDTLLAQPPCALPAALEPRQEAMTTSNPSALRAWLRYAQTALPDVLIRPETA